VDSQTVRCTPQAGERSVDAGKNTNGRKRHVLVDTLGLMLLVLVTVGSVQDRDGGRMLLERARVRFPRLTHLWVDGAYRGGLVQWVGEVCGWPLEIIKRNTDLKGFVEQPRRWVTFAGVIHPLSSAVRDFEGRSQTTKFWMYLASIQLLLRRLDPS